MKLLLPFVACFFLFSCSEEHEMRREIEGRWTIESIRWIGVDASGLDSLLVPQNATIDFGRCRRRGDRLVGCTADVSLLGFTIPYGFELREGHIAFFPAGSSAPPERNPDRGQALLEVRVLSLFWAGKEFSLSGDLERELFFERRDELELRGQVHPVNVQIMIARGG